MKNYADMGSLNNLREDYSELIEKKKLNIKSAYYSSGLGVDAEQLWLRYYKENGILPTIKQAREISAPLVVFISAIFLPPIYLL